jgi:molybdate transport system ATP-binding protein
MGEIWLAAGPSGGGKEQFVRGLIACSGEGESAEVSLEAAAALIAEERRRDEGDFVEGGVDIGRTARRYIAEVLADSSGLALETFPEIARWGIASVLDRGLKYLSTGEIKRVMLCRALLSQKKLLVLSDPFAGLDAQTRKLLRDFFDAPARQAACVVLCMDRIAEVPATVSRALEFTSGAITFDGSLKEYEKALAEQDKPGGTRQEAARRKLRREVTALARETLLREEGRAGDAAPEDSRAPLAEFRDVCVGWNGKTVLNHINWTLNAGEHWLIRGPNGAGKTTMLELITGDNMQAFSNEMYLFGRRRGSGETLWDIRKKLGIVSHRLHTEYRMVGGTSLEGVIISGFHDSIGLYEPPADAERQAARKWLELAGFARRKHEPFSALSYGEQRAAIILRGAVKCPPILILDEPCHALDEQSRRMILDLLETVAALGTSTLLHITHDPGEALSCEKHIFEFCPGETPMYRIIHQAYSQIC